MQRREFSFSAVSLAAATLGMAALPAGVQAKDFEDGSDYLTLDRAAPTEAPTGQIEVIEFFWYNCPHCNSFEPRFDAWAQKSPKDVSIRRVPVAFRPDAEPQQRLYFVLEALGKLGELHKKVFSTIHSDRQPLNTADQMAAWMEKQGIAKARFTELYSSFAVTTKVRKATQLQNAFGIDGVPSLGIDGRYFTSGTQAKTLGRALQVVDALIGQVRSGKAK
jgi:thiol:disulfide interchange protein DsbA